MLLLDTGCPRFAAFLFFLNLFCLEKSSYLKKEKDFKVLSLWFHGPTHQKSEVSFSNHFDFTEKWFRFESRCTHQVCTENGEVLKTVIYLLPVILVCKIMGKHLKAVILSSNTQISKTCYSLLKNCYSLS